MSVPHPGHDSPAAPQPTRAPAKSRRPALVAPAPRPLVRALQSCVGMKYQRLVIAVSHAASARGDAVRTLDVAGGFRFLAPRVAPRRAQKFDCSDEDLGAMLAWLRLERVGV